MSAARFRHRAIQESILRMLDIRFAAVPGLPYLWRHLAYAFATSIVPYTEDEVRVAVADLVERGLARVEDTPGTGELPEKGYTITARGRDFYAANCPWGKLDEFSKT